MIHLKRRRAASFPSRCIPAWNMTTAKAYRDLMHELEEDLTPETDDRTDESDWRAFAWWPYRP